VTILPKQASRRIAGPLGVLAAALGLLAPPAAPAATLEQIGTFNSPLYVTSDPDDADRLFVVERGGAIKLVTGAGTTTFLTVPGVQSGDDEGLLSMAFPPDYSDHGRFYVFYTNTDGNLQLDEFIASGDTVDPATRRAVLTIQHPTYDNHNGGQLQFDADGYLYVATGDGGGAGDPDENAQDLDSLLGKILRIDPELSGTDPYTIPTGNPFVGTAGADEIWSYGLRNPWRFSFDRATGDLLIADVGQATWEELDFDPFSAGWGAGENFGWDCREGAHDFADPSPGISCTGLTFTDPIFEYSNDGSTCAITGGYVVRDPALPELAGRYLYADFCAGQIRSLVPGLPSATDDRSEGLSVDNPSSFGEDANGRLYVASLGGAVYRIEPSPSPPSDPSQPEPPPTAPPPPDPPPPDPPPFTPVPDPAKVASTIELDAAHRKLEDGERAKLIAKLRPCPEREGDRVTLLEDGRRVARKLTNERCRARFRERVVEASRFRAKVNENAGFLADRSPVVKVIPARG
jgi:glucose/arabinose dehydrogenase